MTRCAWLTGIALSVVHAHAHAVLCRARFTAPPHRLRRRPRLSSAVVATSAASGDHAHLCYTALGSPARAAPPRWWPEPALPLA
jgi:hypothetical protein